MLPKPQGLDTCELFLRLPCQHGSSLDATHGSQGRESWDPFFDSSFRGSNLIAMVEAAQAA